MGSKELVRMAGVERTKALSGEARPCNTNVLLGKKLTGETLSRPDLLLWGAM